MTLRIVLDFRAQGGCVLKYDWSDFQSELEVEPALSKAYALMRH